MKLEWDLGCGAALGHRLEVGSGVGVVGYDRAAAVVRGRQ
jgi:hypothetical protein